MAFLCVMLLACFLVVDIGNSVYLNVRQGPGEGAKLLASRETERRTETAFGTGTMVTCLSANL
jgi:hypothetical protein